MEGLTEKRKNPVIRIDSSKNFQAFINRAAECLLSGGLVAYPTESFYGLAVDVKNEAAIKRLFLAKKRRTTNPILILIPSVDLLSPYVDNIPPVAYRLIEEFWPGGLTLIFRASPTVSPLLSAGTGKIGARLSSHPVAMALTHAVGGPISGTSANISGRPACRNAEEVLSAFGEKVDLILDGGENLGEIGSTVLDVTVHPPKVLRQGMVHHNRLKEFIAG